jgi:hypothetical protein
MLDTLISSTAGFVQTNLSLIGNSYPVTFVTGKVRDVMGLPRPEDNDDIAVADPFDDAPTPKSSDYISIYSMIDRAIKGEGFPIYRWVLFGIGIVITVFTIMMVTNHMIMLPWSVRLFAALYLVNIGLFTDFTQANLIYYVLLAYLGLFLYRAYLQTMDPTMNIVPFYTFGFLPLRTAKLNWTDSINSAWLYLLGGAYGPDYNAIVRATEDYMKAEKATIPDYDTLAGTFGLEPLYETFENHLINMNLPGYIPPSPVSVPLAMNEAVSVTKKAGIISRIFKALDISGKAKAISAISKGDTVVDKAEEFTEKNPFYKNPALKQPKPIAI